MFSNKFFFKICVGLLVFLLTSQISLAEAKIETNELLQKTVGLYREATLVEMTVEKRIASDWKPKDIVSNGRLFYSKGKIRWEIETPEKELDLYDGKTFWSVNFASDDFPGSKNKVLEDSNARKHQDQFFLLELLESKNPSTKFEIKVAKDSEEVTEFILKPKKKTAFQDIHVLIGKKDQVFREINFRDDLNTERFILGKPEKKAEIKKGLFSYKPDPKKDDVTRP